MNRFAGSPVRFGLSAIALAGLLAAPRAPAGTVAWGGSRHAPGAAVEAAVFSVWRNLPRLSHVFADLEYVVPDVDDCRHSPAPLATAIADSCCAVRPGQALALVREGAVLGRGRVGSMYAAYIGGGTADFFAYFDAEDLPDSLVDGRLPPCLGGVNRREPFDLYVVGDVDVEPCAPNIEAWRPTRDELAALVATAIAQRAIHYSILPDSLRDHSGYGAWPAPESVADLLRDSAAALTEFAVPFADQSTCLVRTVSWSYCRDSRNGFVEVSTPGLAEPTALPGLFRYLLCVDDVPYLVMMDFVPYTGMWGYFVYRLSPDRPPVRVLDETSWST